jgi:hypothetical protein
MESPNNDPGLEWMPGCSLGRSGVSRTTSIRTYGPQSSRGARRSHPARVPDQASPRARRQRRRRRSRDGQGADTDPLLVPEAISCPYPSRRRAAASVRAASRTIRWACRTGRIREASIQGRCSVGLTSVNPCRHRRHRSSSSTSTSRGACTTSRHAASAAASAPSAASRAGTGPLSARRSGNARSNRYRSSRSESPFS